MITPMKVTVKDLRDALNRSKLNDDAPVVFLNRVGFPGDEGEDVEIAVRWVWGPQPDGSFLLAGSSDLEEGAK